MTFIKFFEKYSEKYYNKNIDINYVKNLSNGDILKLYIELADKNFDEYQKETAIHSLTELRDHMLPYNENDKITLFRMLNIKDVDDIDMLNLGEHYILDLSVVDDVFLHDIGIKKDSLYVVEILVNVSDINFQKTINQRVDYPFEHEISLLTDEHLETVEVKPFKI